MKLNIISTETIKPSSPTPHHLKTHKLSLKDQSNFDTYYPLLLFYSGVDKRSTKISEHLKKSLSETLAHYYPFAGRVKDDFSIDCNDSGVTFIEARVPILLSEVLKRPEIDILENLLPFNTNEKVSTQVNLAVQLNYFDCGGVAICVCFRHVIADATAATNFVKNWSKVADGSDDVKDVIFDCTPIFPPHELTRSIFSSLNQPSPSTNFITKRFVFDGNKIAALKEKIKNRSFDNLDQYPTRFEAVSALIWGALITIARENYESDTLAISIPVNLRKRMNPPLPQQCIGNVIHSPTLNWPLDKAIDLNNLAENIHESIKIVSDDYVRKVYAGDAFVNQLKKNLTEGIAKNKMRTFCLSGWVGLPYYECDFGWGKPTWVGTAITRNDVAILLDTCHGKGIEVWVSLPNHYMAKFQQDAGIITYASFDPTI